MPKTAVTSLVLTHAFKGAASGAALGCVGFAAFRPLEGVLATDAGLKAGAVMLASYAGLAGVAGFVLGLARGFDAVAHIKAANITQDQDRAMLALEADKRASIEATNVALQNQQNILASLAAQEKDRLENLQAIERIEKAGLGIKALARSDGPAFPPRPAA